MADHPSHTPHSRVQGAGWAASRKGCPQQVLTKTFALVGGPIHKHLGGDDIAEGQEHLRQLRVSKLLGEVVDKQVTAFGTCRWGRERRKAPKARRRTPLWEGHGSEPGRGVPYDTQTEGT